MPKRKQFSVVPVEDEWAVTHAGRILKKFDSKDDAVQHARRVARREGPSQLRIHGRNGIIQGERTYDDLGPGKGARTE